MKEELKKANSTVKCGQCSHTAKTLGALKYHIVCSHSKTRRQRNEEKRHTRFSLSQDTEKKHLPKNPAPNIKKCPFRCTECEYKCFQKRNLISHLKKVHQKTEKSSNGSNGIKKCVGPTMLSINKLMCSGCNQVFNKDYELYIHMEFVHREDLVCMFLSSEKEFDRWRREVEKDIDAKYVLIKMTATKQIYKCGTLVHSDSDDTFIQCPSMIIAKFINNGYQVVFHKRHFGHPAIDYSPPQKMETVTVNLNSEREALEFKLRKILRDIYRETCSLNMQCVRKLVDDASILKERAIKLNAEFGAKDASSNKLLRKRKLSLDFDVSDIDKVRRSSTTSNEVYVKEENKNTEVHNKPKGDIKCKPIENLISLKNIEIVPKILNTFTLTEDVDSQTAVEVKPDIATDVDTNIDDEKGENSSDPKDILPEIQKARSKFDDLLSNSTFNETYESFVKTNFHSNTTKEKTKASFAYKNPSNFYSSKKKSKLKPSFANKSDDDRAASDQSDSQNNDLLVVRKKKKKIAMKTKLGQFSPKKSPTIDNSPPSLNPLNLNTTKFQEYEVQEREDDCNILILKF